MAGPAKGSDARKIVKAAGIMFFGLAFAKAVTYFYRLLVARAGTDVYGMLSIGIAVLQMAVVFAMLGLGTGVMRYVSFFRSLDNPAKTKGVITFSLKAVTATGLLAAFLLIVFADGIATGFFHDARLAEVIRIFAVGVPLLAATSVLNAAMRGFQRIEYAVYISNVAESVLRLGISAAAIGIGAGLLGISVAYVLTLAVSALFSLYALEKYVFPILFTKIKSVHIRKELFNYSVPLLFTEVLYLVMQWTDTILLGYFKDVSVVGIYNVALPTATLMLILAASTTQLFTPIVTGLFGRKRMGEINGLYRRVTKWNFIATFPLFLAFSLFATQALRVLFGAEYEAGAGALTVLSLGYLVVAVLTPASELLLAFGKTKVFSVSVIVAASLNLALNIVLIPPYGMAGGAIATSIALGLYGAISALYVYRSYGLQPFSLGLAKPLIAGLLAAAAATAVNSAIPHPAPLPLFLSVFVVFAIVYAALIFAFRVLDAEDMEMVRALARKVGAGRFLRPAGKS